MASITNPSPHIDETKFSLAGSSFAFDSKDDRWTAVVDRDANANGVFFYSVATTGVYCRPSCAARLARRENVGFHDTCADAEFAGFRPCKRCRPNEAAQAEIHVDDAKSTIRFAVSKCSLGAILVAATDKGVCAILLDDTANTLVRDLQDQFPDAQLTGGDSDFEQLVAKVVSFEESDARDLQDQFPDAQLTGGDSDFEQLVAKVVSFIEAPSLGLDLPLDVQGTAFQQRVWRVLREIPAGETASYSAIAKRIGSPQSVRAVAGACAANAIAVAIPCHRVVRQNGGLSGYRWGVERKQTLLDREAVS